MRVQGRSTTSQKLGGEIKIKIKGKNVVWRSLTFYMMSLEGTSWKQWARDNNEETKIANSKVTVIVPYAPWTRHLLANHRPVQDLSSNPYNPTILATISTALFSLTPHRTTFPPLNWPSISYDTKLRQQLPPQRQRQSPICSSSIINSVRLGNFE